MADEPEMVKEPDALPSPLADPVFDLSLSPAFPHAAAIIIKAAIRSMSTNLFFFIS
jgi:hypothetical protein